MCRLSTPYRATTDLDTVHYRAAKELSQLTLLVTDAEINDLPDDPTDRLHVQSHAWAASTASGLMIRVEGLAPLMVAVSEPGPLIAMKLQAIMNRGSAKEGTDLLGIVRLTLDRRCGPVSRDQLEAADPQLRADALLHARRWFDQRADRSLGRIRAVPEGLDVEVDDVRLVGELLVAALES